MNPVQVNFAVHDLAAGVRFYSAMFASGPAVLKPDCAKWMLNDPRVSFTIFVGAGGALFGTAMVEPPPICVAWAV